jgi:hypothetical protein
LRELGLPFDDLAANEYSGALRIRAVICGRELFQLPHDGELDDGSIRSQHDRVHLSRRAHVANADTLRLLPRKQQLHPQFDGLLWVPPASISAHHDDWRERTESRHGRVPDHGFGLRDVPLDYYLGCGSLRSQLDGVCADQWARQRDLQFVPHQ